MPKLVFPPVTAEDQFAINDELARIKQQILDTGIEAPQIVEDIQDFIREGMEALGERLKFEPGEQPKILQRSGPTGSPEFYAYFTAGDGRTSINTPLIVQAADLTMKDDKAPDNPPADPPAEGGPDDPPT